MHQIDQSPLRKRLLAEGPRVTDSAGEIDLVAGATLAYTSEDPAHPIENLVDQRYGNGGTYWAGERSDATEQIVIEFDEPHSISRLVYEVEERQLHRTQEVRVELSGDAGHAYRQVLVQEYSFSPEGATFQREDVRLTASSVTHVRLTIVPNKNGSGRATLTTLRLFS